MVHKASPHTEGYEAAYREIYEIINDEGHQAECGECRPCGVILEVIEVLMETLAGKLSQDEFYMVAILLAKTGTGIRDNDGRIRIDWWGRLNAAIEEDGTYEWPKEGCDA